MTPTRTAVVAQLAALLGNERAEEIVTENLAALGEDSTWTPARATALVERLAHAPGLVGLAARRMLQARTPSTNGATTSSNGATASPAPRPSRTTDEHEVVMSPNLRKLITMLSASLGDAKTRQLIDDAMRRRGLSREKFERDDAITVLEDLARESGLVGTVARFAKARVHLELT